METQDKTSFFRYESIEYGTTDQDGDYITPRIPNPQVILRRYISYKETPKGHWIRYGAPTSINDKGKWVSKTTRKRFAHLTKEQALDAFIIRNQKRVQILSRQLASCKISIEIAISMKSYQNKP